MKHLISNVSIFLLLLFSLISCTKEVGDTSKILSPFSSLSITWSNYKWVSTSGIDPSNPLNIYDNIGQEHNDGCNYYLAHFVDLGYIPTNENDYFDECLSVYKELEIDAGSIENPDTIKAQFLQYIAPMVSSITYPQLVNINSYDSTSAALKLDFLENVIVETKDSNINYIISYIKALEAPIISSGAYTSSQKSDFLKYSSLLRYSLAYWYDVEKGLIIDYNTLGIGGSETDTIVAVNALKSVASHDANWAKSNKTSSSSANAKAASWVLWGADAVTSGIAWGLRRIADGFNAAADWVDSWF